MLKKIVVVYKGFGIDGTEYSDQLEIASKKDYLTVHNNPDGLLVVNDVVDKTHRVETVAVFNINAWHFWKEK